MEKLSDNNWVDIVTISSPPATEWHLVLFIIIPIISICIGILIYLMRPEGRALRRVSQLKYQLSGQHNKNILQQLERTLCQYFRTSQLHYIQLHSRQWSDYRAELIKCAYQKKQPEADVVLQLIQQARQFIRMKQHA